MKKIIGLSATLFAITGVFAQHAMGDNTSAAEFNTILKAANRATRDFASIPDSFSIKNYAPEPQNQDPYGTCVAWSAAYAARTISYAVQKKMTNKDIINKSAFSPRYMYYKVKPATDVKCMAGASILTAMEVMTSTGVMLKKEELGTDDCAIKFTTSAEKLKANPYRIKDFLRLTEFDTISKNDIRKIKKSLLEKKPVVISMKLNAEFDKVPASGIWTTSDSDYILPGRHAMCIVGYNDRMAGGAFEVMNSWGTRWGNNGFFWLKYDQVMEKGVYAVELMDFEGGKTEISGDLEFVKWIDSKDIPMAVTRVKINTNNTLVKNDKLADFSLYKLTEPLKTKDQFKVRFSSTSKCYIYVFDEDNAGVISPLFPSDPKTSAAINCTDTATYYLPSESSHALLDATKGIENFCILYSKSEIDFSGLIEYIRTKKISIYQGVKDKLAARLLDLRLIKFSDQKIAFTVPSTEQSVLCFFVEMKHNVL